MSRRDRLWVFDLDNTLHNASAHIFPHINRAMMAYIQRHLGLDEAAATRLRQDYWQRYGATLRGLVRHHGVDADDFLWHTHQFPELERLLDYESGLAVALARLPGRKIVFSNGPQHYARMILAALGVERRFARVYSIEDVAFRPKPDRRAFREVLRRECARPGEAIMVEDSLDNLRTAKRIGMRTVWVTQSRKPAADADLVVRSVLELPRLGRL